jgi:hypothetical protein
MVRRVPHGYLIALAGSFDHLLDSPLVTIAGLFGA